MIFITLALFVNISVIFQDPSVADDTMTQPSSAENLLTDSRSEEVDSGIGILSDADKIHNGHRSRMTVDGEEGEFYDYVDDERNSNKRTMQVMTDLGTKCSSDPVLKTRTDEDRMTNSQIAQVLFFLKHIIFLLAFYASSYFTSLNLLQNHILNGHSYRIFTVIMTFAGVYI